MKLEIILALISIMLLETNTLDSSKVNIETASPFYKPTKVKPEDRRKILNMFPRNPAKFIVSTEQPIKTPNSENNLRSIKRPSLRKMIIQTTTESTRNIHRIKKERTPLMKARKFVQEDHTVKPVSSTVTPLLPKKLLKKETDVEIPAGDIVKGGQFLDSAEIDSTGETLTEELIEGERIPQDRPSTTVANFVRKYPGSKRPKRDFLIDSAEELQVTNGIPLDIQFVEELKMDGKEFIFLSNNDQLNEGKFDFANNYQEKSKRSIIEEESLASTIPTFSYTGRDTELKNELTYRNINE